MKDPAPPAEAAAIHPALGEISTAYGATLAAPSQAPANAPLAKGTILGRYVILDCLGEGGMGIVYAAYDPELDRKVALKLLLSDDKEGPFYTEGRARLLREAQAMARLSHPNVIAVHDVGTFDGQVFIAMEFVDGATLTAWLKERERAIPEVIAMFTQAGRGLAVAHAHGIVHRDFKPDNVLVGKDGRARVLDFGLAHAEMPQATAEQPSEGGTRQLDATSPAESLRLPEMPLEAEAKTVAAAGSERMLPPASAPLSARASALDAQLTRTGAFLGTPMYMAPEQFTGLPTGTRTDQFSFCVALAEALYGEPPFAGDKVLERARHVVNGKVRDEPRGRRLPPSLRRALLRGLSVKAESRFASMDALLAAIEMRPPRTPWRWAGAAAAVFLPIAALGAFVASREAPGAECDGAEQKLSGVWDAPRKQAILNAFLASGKPYAKDAFGGVERALDAYTAQWVAMHTDTCLATRVRGEQSEELLDLRMECLSQRLAELRATTDVSFPPQIRTPSSRACSLPNR